MLSRILGALAIVAIAVSCASAEEPNSIGEYIQASPGVVMPQYTRNTQELYCDGGDGPLGHPRVFLTMTKNGTVDCPYCGRHFVLAKGAKTAAH